MYAKFSVAALRTGTVMLADINPGAGSSRPLGAFVFENRFYFTADDGTSGRELWATDGTPAGTFRVLSLADAQELADPR